MKNITKTLALVALVLSSSFLLSACGKKTDTTSTTKTNTKASKQIELASGEKPYISLIPTADGHTLDLKVTNIPTKFTTAEYELIYTAKDENIEIEKGVSGTVKLAETSNIISKDLLLGTASCTNGCKYKYDEGVNGGTLTLTLTTDNKEYVSFETPFVLQVGTDINKNKKINLTQENLTINGTVTTKGDYFVAIKNFGSIYSVFSNGKGAGKITSIEPTTVTKTDTASITGDYTISQ